MNDEFVTRFVRGAAGVGIGTLLQTGLGFVAFLIGARALPEAQFGAFVLFQVIVMFFLALGDVLLQKVSVTRFLIAEPEEHRRTLIVTALSYKLLFAVLIGFVLLILQPLANRVFHSDVLARLCVFLPLFFIVSSLDELLFAILQGLHKYREIAISQSITGIIRLSVVAVLLLVLHMDVMGLLYAFLASLVASVLVQLWCTGIRPSISFNRAVYARLFHFGLPLGLNNLLTFFFLKLDRFMLGAMMGPAGVALYEVAGKIPDTLQRLYQAFQSVFFPSMSELFAQDKRSAAETVLNNSMRLLSFGTISMAAFIMLFRNELTRLLFSSQYTGSAVAFTLLMVSLNMAISGNLMGTALIAAGRSHAPIRISIVMALASTVSNVLLIPRFGVVGAAAAAVVANYCTNLTISVWYLKRESIAIWWNDFLKPIALFAVLVAIVVTVRPEHPVLKMALLTAFMVSGVLLGVISRRDFLLARSIGRSRVPVVASQR